MKNMKAIIIWGPPGSGKGTQAELLARSFGFIHFDTGRFLERLYLDKNALKDSIIKKEKKLFDEGFLNTPLFVLKIVSDATKKIGKGGLGVVYSGSPRTLFEAYGDEKNKGLLETLCDVYGKKNVHVIQLLVKDEIVTHRNNSRKVCSLCGLPKLAHTHADNCVFCGAPLRTRSLDNPTVMKKRLEEYKERTYPIIAKMKTEKYHIHKINGEPLPFVVFASVKKTLKL